MSDELHIRCRPSKLTSVVGQPAAVTKLKGYFDTKTFPHVTLFIGPSGCGKTTLARICKDMLGCGDADFTEMDAATNRGIDAVRSIKARMGLAPIQGPCRVWLIDECQQLTAEAQGAFLKTLEDTPKHCFFMLATTDPQKLKNTIRTRCDTIQVKTLNARDLVILLKKVAKRIKFDLCDDTMDKIIEFSDGSARMALVHLNSIRSLDDQDDQLMAIASASEKAEAFKLARLLMNTRATWAEVAAFLKDNEDDPEGLRWMIMGYARTVLLGKKNHDRAYEVLNAFRDNFFDSKRNGLAAACWEVVKGL